MASAEETEKLLEATQANDVETARAALAAGADPNGQSQNNWMLVRRSAAGRLPAAGSRGQLLSCLPPRRAAQSGRPAPLVAAEFGSLDVLKLLLDHGAKKDAKDGVRAVLALFPYAHLPRSAPAPSLRCAPPDSPRLPSAAAAADAARRPQSDNTMVHKAAKAGKEEMLRYLLEELKLDANAVTTVRSGRRSGRVSR